MNWKHTDRPTLPYVATPVMGMYKAESLPKERIHTERTVFAVVVRGDGGEWYYPVGINGKDLVSGQEPIVVPAPDSWAYLSEAGLRTR